MPEQLSRLHMEVLEFERATWKYSGTRAAAILERFGWSEARHAQVVLHLIDQPAAAAYDPELVARLRRLRAQRAARSSRRVGFDIDAPQEVVAR